MDKKYGLLGRKLDHSYSPQLHNMLSDYEYKLYEVEPEDLDTFMEATRLSGMNVTIPYKKSVMKYCVELSDAARKMGCCNTLVKMADGWHGDNTDYYGFCAMVKNRGIDFDERKVLVLGSGGASNTVCRASEDLGAREIVVISRSGDNNYSNLDKHADADIIVNATPVGMFPYNGQCMLELKQFPKLEGAVDLIYNPERTALLLQAEELGIKHTDGLYMLVAQAKKAAEIFAGKLIPESENERINAILRAQMNNIVLIGMPGCGKSSVGKLLAQKTGRRFIDADQAIVESAGVTIPEIFKQDGEAGFRKIETKVMEELGKLSGVIIATGGGCVTRPENYPLIHQNGVIFWLQRDISKLPTNGRPISQANPLEKLYADRKDKYAAFADVIVDNNGALEATVDAIIAN